jgi:hypothetical protein
VEHRYTDAALGQLRAQGRPPPTPDAACPSPLADAHVNMLGRYAFTQPSSTGLRPLRDPDAPDGEN